MKPFLPKRHGKNRKYKFDKIPEGFYCYKLNGEVGQSWNKKLKSFVEWYGIVTCPFWGRKKGQPYCKYLKMSSILIDDQVKECSLNKNYTFE